MVAGAHLTPFAEGVWVASAPARINGMRLAATMTVLRLGDGTLLVHSPIALTAERRAAVEAIGPVAHLYAPNLYHHLRAGEWAAAFPSARLHAPAGLAKKRRDLRIDRTHDAAPEPAFEGVVDEIRIGGFRLEESVLVYRPARTLVVADLVHNVGRPHDAWTELYTRVLGFHDRVALSRMIRWLGFSNRAATRRSLDEILARPFERILVGHGSPVVSGAPQAIAAAYAWLPAASR